VAARASGRAHRDAVEGGREVEVAEVAVKPAEGRGRQRPAPRPRASAALPTIYVTGRALREVAAEAVAALVGANDPAALFIRFGANHRE